MLQEWPNDASSHMGEFRLFGLSPGRYLIAAEPETWNRVVGDREFSGAGKSDGERGYAKLYYPLLSWRDRFGKSFCDYCQGG
jgi:hypothetical protein